MISFLQGQVVANNDVEINVLTAGGVGYRVAVNPTAARDWPVGREARILTYLVVREGIMDLYGFANEAERSLFMHFLSVSGIGPKTALHLLSLGTVAEITSAIARADLDYLTRVSGIGKKTAERIMVELKNKLVVSAAESTKESGRLGDVIEGLVALGYSSFEARDVVKKLDTKGKTSEQLLKEALQGIK